jgi:4-amino-4-deoxy-L-arabinose transferase-like glycosyltransferase
MRVKAALVFIVVVDLLFLLYGVHTLSISYKEAHIFFHEHNFLHLLVRASTELFGQNDYALRAPFILLHLLSIVLMYQISKFYLKRDEDRVLSVLVFVLLPGIVSSALLVNAASVVIFFTLLFIYLFLRKKEHIYIILLPLLLLVDNSFIMLYFALVAYGAYSKNRFIMIYASILFLIGLYIYGFAVGGKPRGYFLDTFAAYSLVFSPLLFLYFFYTMYRILVREKKSILWVISFTALIVSILLSFRQRIIIEDFAPFVVVSVPLMVQVFVKSYRMRLPELRRSHNVMFVIVFTFLLLNFYGTYFNQFFYRFYAQPEKHFAYKYHVAYELAQALKKEGIHAISTEDKALQLRLKFYQIGYDPHYKLLKSDHYHDSDSVTISYMNFPINSYSVSKVNN